ncbi:metallophosphoesterase [Campylobacter sp. JMF_01 NE2]|uniref:metallophosphoesterase family protein n=1 Tax=unclassified Campylobacter TaxID=2593542 RepID=UPI0022E9AC31|nr:MULTISPECIES: metallophosphoesterase [unclassified Campylobacter]MDA3051888.1 metallophosphoesterase [Campylobacter sp. JMF_03 NE3]MDA3066222.1 metallophosphoesterase [Campylobacter sp. JMF_01 NE2]
MARIFITGDTHGGWGGFSGEMKRFEKFRYKTGKELCKDDFLIIAGDFGFIWESSPDKDEIRWLKYFNERNYTTLFIDGNHENFARLNAYKITEFHGGKVHKISESVYHLMRGQVYELTGHKVLSMGGAASIDREYRTQNISWWEGENISEAELNEAYENLAKHDFSVDLVLSHTAPNSIAPKVLALNEFALDFHDPNGDLLEEIYRKIKFKKWFFGHFHEELFCVNSQFVTLWHDIVELKFESEKIKHLCVI